MSDGNPRVGPVRSWVVRSMRTFGNELELYIAAAGRENEMHRTDLAGLSMVMDEESQGHPVTPGRLSSSLQLSAPATSAMLDRLERLGHVRRTPHATDRRSVVVEITDHAREVGGAMFGRMAQHLGPVLAAYDDDQLALIAEFLDRASEATRAAREETPPADPLTP
ncbi:MarR family transcriptional regulator [Nocardioides panacis]|uniref:MarR family transcriptional regulator n=1 Tax=Nocardioides panacis TaxID=2849501 RepID=A0A975XZU6_9ACTN|nr:MarR family transcriptional regulator [Nocardioides panacis]QWZ07763.1 MarR family transcriptional regulator [Nocardioides panacis]